ncbi:MAG: L,D-transpeptidase family protein [Candidatus Taylorbacteria bacterium]
MTAHTATKYHPHVKLIFIGSFLFLVFASAAAMGFNTKLKYGQGRNASTLLYALDRYTENSELLQGKIQAEKYLKTRTIADDTIEAHIPSVGKFISADLDHMELALYENHLLLKKYPIIAKGKPGSFWETPSGDYQILAKVGTHFSSVGEVYMPWSMQFNGNFFIHGWPYYPDGRDVALGYSGGCIRMKTDDAKEIYEFSKTSTPIFVYEKSDEMAETRALFSLKNIPPPEISAQAYIVADVNTGEVFLDKNIDTPMPIASLTKLMTAIVANEVIMFDRKITITPEVVETLGESGNLKAGEVMTANDVLYPLLMESSNDAARAFSAYYGESSFISHMNKKAKAIGMKNTTYADSSGILSGNTSTVYDLYILSKYLKNNKSFILNITRLPTKKITSSFQVHNFGNFNVFSAEKNFLGGKTGYTRAANGTMISLFEIPIGNEKRNIAFIVLSSQNQEKDVRALLTWFEEAAS